MTVNSNSIQMWTILSLLFDTQYFPSAIPSFKA